jgi:telomere-associated protein RIF1
MITYSQVSWTKLVDAFFPSQATEIVVQQTVISPLKPIEQASAQVKRIRLIMVPLCRVLSRSRNIALSSSCLSTWHYLLHRLGNLINHLPILEAAFGPILKIVFSFGISDQNKPLWSFCLNLFHDFVSSKNRYREDLCAPVNQNLLAQSCTHIKALLDVQHIKWLPWDISCFHFQLDILGIILKPELFQDMIPEMLVIVMDSATEIFRFLLQGIQIELREQHAYEQVNECITNVCTFAKKLLLDHIVKNSVNKCATLLEFGLRFVKVIVDELDHSLLASENIEVCLDIEHIKDNQHAEYSPKVSLPRIRSLSYMEMASPAVYVAALSLSMISQYTGELSHRDAEKLVLILASSLDVLESFHTAVSFMYMQIGRPTYNRERLKWLMVWNLYAKQLNRKIISYLETDSALSYHDVLHQFFCYPFLIFLNAENSSESSVSVLQDLEVESTIEIYRSLSTNSCNSKLSSMVFFDGFYKYLVCTIDGNMALFQANLEHLSDKFENATILSALGEIVIGLLQNDQMLIYANQELKETSEDSAVCRQRKLFLNWFKLANRFVEITLPNGTPVSILATMTMTSALSVIYKLFMICRFMRLSSFHFKANPAGQHQVTSRYLSRST